MASHVLTQPSSIGTSEGLRNQVGGNLQHHAVFTTRQLISNVPVKKKEPAHLLQKTNPGER